MLNKNRIIEIKLSVILIISVVVGIQVAKWGNEPLYRPLVQDFNSLDSTKIADIFDNNNIKFYVNPSDSVLYVNHSQTQQAKQLLVEHGMKTLHDSNNATELLDRYQNLLTSLENDPSQSIIEQGLLYKPLSVFTVIIFMIIFVFRPIISYLTKDYEDKKNQ